MASGKTDFRFAGTYLMFAPFMHSSSLDVANTLQKPIESSTLVAGCCVPGDRESPDTPRREIGSIKKVTLLSQLVLLSRG